MKAKSHIFTIPSKNNENKRIKYTKNIPENLNRLSTPVLFPESNIDSI
jgi:hypothetical protein